MLMPAREDIENRRPVWLALSELFLDTEHDFASLGQIASVLGESPYSLNELDEILYDEVYPVCVSNLRPVAGVWGGFDEDWLEAAIRRHLQRGWNRPRCLKLSRWMIRADWNSITRLLADKRESIRQPPE